MQQSLPTVTLRPREDRRVRRGHAWVFSNEIARVDGEAGVGSLVRVVAHHGPTLGVGLYNPHSLIAVRMTDGEAREVDAAWFAERIASAVRLRERLYPGARTYRLLHSESDAVPGVIVDRYESTAVVQIAAAGMDQRRDHLFDALMELEGIEGVVERNDHAGRSLEGLPERVGVVRGDAGVQEITDGMLRFEVDPLGAQKTGFYLDQRENRIAMRRYAPGGRVLDLFANTGGFALHALDAGAREVIAVESSDVAAAAARRNAELNGLQKITIQVSDSFAWLRERAAGDARADMVIMDPPPFARSKKHVAAARRRYVELLTLGLGVLADEGVAFFSTCSHHLTSETFHEIVRESLGRAGRTAVILEERGAAPDHPVHPMMPETGYLHAAVLRVGSGLGSYSSAEKR